MNCEILLYVILFLFSPAIVLLGLILSYIFFAPIMCLWAEVFNFFGWKKPLEMTKKCFPEMYYPKGASRRAQTK